MGKMDALLSALNENSSAFTIKKTFLNIADLLLFHSHIETDDGDYRILEIEFYFQNKNHEDDITITRNEKPGMWWLHESGVDITFKSEGKKCCGGILIRSIVAVNSNKVICGPRNCCWYLFYSSALSPSQAPFIKMNKEGTINSGIIARTKRYIPGDNKGIDSKYRFYVKGLNLDVEKNYDASPWK